MLDSLEIASLAQVTSVIDVDSGGISTSITHLEMRACGKIEQLEGFKGLKLSFH